MLHLAARHGKWCLGIGLILGFVWTDLALALRPHLPVLIAALLFLAALRVGPDAFLGGWRGSATTVALVVIYQVAVPLTLVVALFFTGVLGTTAALAAVLVFSAPSVTGSANFALLIGVRPDAALRLLMVGTTLFPLTVLPVLISLPVIDAAAVFTAALRLIGVVVLAGGLAFLLRHHVLKTLTDTAQLRLDGASAILLGVVVIGLMSALGPLVRQSPGIFLMWLSLAFALNFGAQFIAWRSFKARIPPDDRAACSIVAGNRNIALFLVALPPTVTDNLLSFIGCYQIPMYLTPILLSRFYRRAALVSDGRIDNV